MVTLEKMLFDVNEAWHHMGLIPVDHYLTVNSLLFSIIMTFLLAPLLGRALNWLYENETYKKYNGVIIITIIFGIFMIMGEYGAILISLLLMMFIRIVYTNPKYKSIQEYIDRIF